MNTNKTSAEVQALINHTGAGLFIFQLIMNAMNVMRPFNRVLATLQQNSTVQKLSGLTSNVGAASQETYHYFVVPEIDVESEEQNIRLCRLCVRSWKQEG